MSKIISISNQKGGVGKTTTAINLSAALAKLGAKILLIDFDPQSNSTSGLGLKNDNAVNTTYEMLVGNASAKDCLTPADMPGLFVIRSDINLVGIEIELVGIENREYVLKNKIQQITDDFDFIFIDCPPSLSLITLNALIAANTVLIPVQCEYYALEGLTLLLNTIKKIKAKLNPALDIEGYLLTMFDTRLRLSHQVANEMHQYFKDKVYDVKIMRNVKLGESPSFGKPIVTYDPESMGARNYTELAYEFMRRNGKEIKDNIELLKYEGPEFVPASAKDNIEQKDEKSNLSHFS